MFFQGFWGNKRNCESKVPYAIQKYNTRTIKKLKESLEGMDGWTDGQTDGETEKGREGTTCQGKFI